MSNSLTPVLRLGATVATSKGLGYHYRPMMTLAFCPQCNKLLLCHIILDEEELRAALNNNTPIETFHIFTQDSWADDHTWLLNDDDRTKLRKQMELWEQT